MIGICRKPGKHQIHQFIRHSGKILHPDPDKASIRHLGQHPPPGGVPHGAKKQAIQIILQLIRRLTGGIGIEPMGNFPI